MSDISEWLTIFPENDKFNGKNWDMFKMMITLAAEVQEVEGYLLGTIPDPAASTVTPSAAATIYVPGETPWYSTQQLKNGMFAMLGPKVLSYSILGVQLAMV